MASYTYHRQYRAHHLTAGDVMLPDQVYERQAVWDQADMPFPAVTAAGETVLILLRETDA